MKQNGEKRSTQCSVIWVDQFLSQAWIYQNRYHLTHNTVSPHYVRQLNQQAFNRFGFNTFTYKGYTTDKNVDIELCNWLDKHTDYYAHVYDYDIVPGYVKPIVFFDNAPWRMLLLSYNPLQPNLTQDQVFTNARFIAQCYAEKDELYAPKSFLLEDVELGWIAFDDLEDCIFIHHIQARGALKEHMGNNDLRWFYRYLIRRFVQLVPYTRWDHIFVPTAPTLSTYTKRQTGTPSIITPFSSRVLGQSGFHHADWNTFQQTSPLAAKQCKLLDVMKPEEITFWRYQHDHTHSVAD